MIVSLCAASMPSTSKVGSASAKPRACASARTSANEAPRERISERMKFDVPLMMPAIHSMLFAVKPSRSALMIGIPPATDASNPTITPLACAAAKMSVPWLASSALFAVTMCLPLAIASSTSDRAGSMPPMSSHTMSTSGCRITTPGSLVRFTPATPRVPSRARSSVRVAIQVIAIGRPARRWISSWLRRRTSHVPLPTVPNPRRPTLIGFMGEASSRRKAGPSVCLTKVAGSRLAPGRHRDSSPAPPPIPVEELRDPADRLDQVVAIREEHQTKVIGRGPVEPGSLHDQNLLLLEQIENELLVVLDRVHRRIEPRKQIQRRLRLDAGHAGDRGDHVVGEIALLRETAAGRDQVVDALVAAERRLDRELARNVRAQPHRGEEGEAVDVILGVALVTGEDHPPAAVAARPVVLRQAVESDDQHVVGKRRDRRMTRAVVERLVVDLVGQHDQLMLPRDLDQLAQQVVRIQRAGRIVRIDDDDRACPVSKLRADVVEVRQPAGCLVADIVPRPPATEAHGRRPQRIVGCGHEHLVAVVEQPLHRHHDQLGNAVPDEDVVQLDTGDSLLLHVLHDRLARREQSLAVRIAGRLRQVHDHVMAYLVRRVESEWREVADVELDDAMPLFLHQLRALHDRAADVVADVRELRGLADRLQHRFHAATALTRPSRRSISFTPRTA